MHLVRKNTSGPLRELLTTLLTAERSPEDIATNGTADGEKADAKKLNEQGITGNFDYMFATRTYSHMRNVFDVFYIITHSQLIEDRIREQTSGDYLQALLHMVTMVKDKNHYFATRLKSFTEGAGTDLQDIAHVIISRCDKDILTIRKKYDEVYGSLKTDIEGDFSDQGHRKWTLKMFGIT